MTRAPTVRSFLWFHGKGEEAANFYVSVVPNSRITHVEVVGGVTTVISFELAGEPFVIMDAPGQAELNEAFSISVLVDGQAEVDRLWDALLDGGSSSMTCPLWARATLFFCLISGPVFS